MIKKKITITKEDFNKTLREILIDLKISPEIVLVKIDGTFRPISTVIKKETEIEVLQVIKWFKKWILNVKNVQRMLWYT